MRLARCLGLEPCGLRKFIKETLHTIAGKINHELLGSVEIPMKNLPTSRPAVSVQWLVGGTWRSPTPGSKRTGARST